MKIYLAGGTHTDWQDRVLKEFDNDVYRVKFLDPRKNQSLSPEEYTWADLKMVYDCDILFAFMEFSNPTGIGMAVEVGCAIALEKIVIAINERGDSSSMFMLPAAAFQFRSFHDGLDKLSDILLELAEYEAAKNRAKRNGELLRNGRAKSS